MISLLNEPNTYSPANVDASIMYRRWRDSKGRDKEYENIIRYDIVNSVVAWRQSRKILCAFSLELHRQIGYVVAKSYIIYDK